jgi:hypothetical protein
MTSDAVLLSLDDLCPQPQTRKPVHCRAGSRRTNALTFTRVRGKRPDAPKAQNTPLSSPYVVAAYKVVHLLRIVPALILTLPGSVGGDRGGRERE